MVKTPIPTAESLVAFLEFHDWEVEEKDEFFYTMKPPKSLKPDTFRLKINYHFGGRGSGYDSMMYIITSSIANFYNWNHWALMLFLAKNKPKDVKKHLKEGTEKQMNAATA